MPATDRRTERWTSIAVKAWAIVGVLLLVAFALWLISKVASALVPFLFAGILVYLFRGPVARLERRGMKRGLAVGVCYLVAFAVLGLLGFFVLPALFEQVSQFAEDFPSYYEGAYQFWLDLQAQYQAVQIPKWVDQALANLKDVISTQAVAWSSAAARDLIAVGSSAVTLLFNGFLALVIGFWLLKDLPVIKRELIQLGGPDREHEAAVIGNKVSGVLGGYLRGQLVVSLATAVIVSVGLAILGVPYALVLGLLAGTLNVIPYIGPLITEAVAAIVAVFVSPWLALGAVVVILVAQQVTDLFITPRVMSEQVDLHPVLVIFSLLAGGTVFGFTGLLLAIPVAAVGKGLFVHYFEKWTDSTLTTAGGALFRRKSQPCETPEPSSAPPADAESQDTNCAEEK